MELVDQLRAAADQEARSYQRAELCRAAADEIERLVGLANQMVAPTESEIPEPVTFTPPRPECPQCGERERIEINLVDVGVGSVMDTMVGSYRCLNPECPSNRRSS